MRKFFLFLTVLFFCAENANAAFHEAIVKTTLVSGINYRIDITPISVSPALSYTNMCNDTYSRGYPCVYGIHAYAVNAQGTSSFLAASGTLVDRNPPNWCNSAGCNVSVGKAKTVGELVPLMQYRGAFGKTNTYHANIARNVVGLKTCLRIAISEPTGNLSIHLADCGPVFPLITTCDIVDTNAVVDFGYFGSDVTSRQASGSFKINCSSAANVRVKFASSVTHIPLSEDGRLNASLKVRNSKPGSTETESFIEVPGGEQEIFIDGELKNNDTSHTGPFSASVVAIVEVA